MTHNLFARKSFKTPTLLVSLLPIMLASCGGGSSATTGTASTSTTAPTPAAPFAAPIAQAMETSGTTASTQSQLAPTPSTDKLCYQSNSSVVPVIATQADWDAKWNAQYGTTTPNLSGDGETFAWQGSYDVRAYISMAKTYGDAKYLDRATATINYWFANTDGGPLKQGWAYSYGPSQMMLDTGVIAQAIALFAYEVWNDSRFASYRSQATTYIAQLEPMLHTYDAQWVTNAPYPGSPSSWVYATCGNGGNSLCNNASLTMYNQSATLAKTLLLLSRTYQLEGMVPDPNYLVKADATATYFKTFATTNNGAYAWSYGGARTSGNGPEDISHGDLDLSLISWAEHYGLGGLTSADMTYLVNTEEKIFNGGTGQSVESFYVDGTGGAPTSYYIPAIGWNWLDITDFDPTADLFNKTVAVFNAYSPAPPPNPAGYYLGWAEILRKKNCISLY